MRYTKAMKRQQFFDIMARYGIGYDDANKLRLIEKTLANWSELECGTGEGQVSRSIERDEVTEIPYMRVQYPTANGYHDSRYQVADKEKGALKRLAAIMAKYPDLVAYHQGDPRGCSLYVVRKSDLVQDGQQLPIDSFYTRGYGVAFD